MAWIPRMTSQNVKPARTMSWLICSTTSYYIRAVFFCVVVCLEVSGFARNFIWGGQNQLRPLTQPAFIFNRGKKSRWPGEGGKSELQIGGRRWDGADAPFFCILHQSCSLVGSRRRSGRVWLGRVVFIIFIKFPSRIGFRSWWVGLGRVRVGLDPINLL